MVSCMKHERGNKESFSYKANKYMYCRDILSYLIANIYNYTTCSRFGTSISKQYLKGIINNYHLIYLKRGSNIIFF